MKTRLLAAEAPGAVEEAAAALARGDLVAFPTDTVYGLSAGQEHVRKLYGAKDRPQDKRIPVLLSDPANLGATRTIVSGPGQKRRARARAAGVTMALASRLAVSESSTGMRLSLGRSLAP